MANKKHTYQLQILTGSFIHLMQLANKPLIMKIKFNASQNGSDYIPDTLDNTAASALLAHLREERTLLPAEKCTAMLRSGEAMTAKPRA